MNNRSVSLPFTPEALMLDLDGTLLDSTDRISETVKLAIDQASRVLPVTLASGRVLEDVAHFARLLGLDGVQISDNGGRLSDPITGQTLKDVTIAPTIAKKLLGQLEKDQIHYVAVDSGRTIHKMDDVIEWEITVVICRMSGQSSAIHRSEIDQDPELSAILSVGSQGEWYVNYTNSSVNKGFGVELYCSFVGIDPNKVMCIGDGLNDLEMFEASGISVAMKHSSESVRRQADFTTDDLAHDGVAQAINKWII